MYYSEGTREKALVMRGIIFYPKLKRKKGKGEVYCGQSTMAESPGIEYFSSQEGEGR